LRQREIRELALRSALRIVDVGEQHEPVRESPQNERGDEREDQTNDAPYQSGTGEELDRARGDLKLAGTVDTRRTAEQKEDRRDAHRASGELDRKVASRPWLWR